jgi:hypothetical protein
LISPLDLSIDLVTVALAFGAGFFALKIRATFKGGRLWRPWQIIAPSLILYGISGVTEVLAESTGSSILDFLESTFELLFVLILVYGLYMFYKAWNPTEAPKK